MEQRFTVCMLTATNAFALCRICCWSYCHWCYLH